MLSCQGSMIFCMLNSTRWVSLYLIRLIKVPLVRKDYNLNCRLYEQTKYIDTHGIRTTIQNIFFPSIDQFQRRCRNVKWKRGFSFTLFKNLFRKLERSIYVRQCEQIVELRIIKNPADELKNSFVL